MCLPLKIYGRMACSLIRGPMNRRIPDRFSPVLVLCEAVFVHRQLRLTTLLLSIQPIGNGDGALPVTHLVQPLRFARQRQRSL